MRLRHVFLLAATAAFSALQLGGCDIWVIIDPPRPSAADLSISVEWNSQVQEVDLYVTYPRPADGNPVNTYGTPVYYDISAAYTASVSGGDPGFFPVDGSANRERVWSGQRHSSFWTGSMPAVEMVRAGSSGGPQTVLVRDLPFVYTGLQYNTVPTEANRLDPGACYAWLGVMEVYVYGVSGMLARASGGGADPVITIRNSAGHTIGEYRLPRYTDIRGMAIAKILMFRATNGYEVYNYYQILPDGQLVTDTAGIRSIGGEEPAVLNVRGYVEEAL